MLELWGEAVRSIEPMLKPAHREQWIRPIQCLAIANGRIRLRAPNRYHKEWFEDNFLPSILQDLEARARQSFEVDFEIVEPAAPEAVTNDLPPPALPEPLVPRLEPRPRALDPRYTFEKFVVGPTNQFAHAAARMVAEAPASKWNPLFIYGGVGLGKTHLLHAVGQELWRQHPDWKIVCVTCELFVSEFIGAMTSVRRQGGVGLMEEFRRRYRE